MQSFDLAPIYMEIADIIGIENTVMFYQHFRGQQITFPQHFYNKEYVIRYIKEHQGESSIREMAKKFGYTERRIRQLLSHNKIVN